MTMLLQTQNKRKTFVSHVDKLKVCSEEDAMCQNPCPDFQRVLTDLDHGDRHSQRDIRLSQRLIAKC